ncbi:hypothetical protein [Mesorhizobium sp. AA22]|uniref:hypothetical protein n=1 Tax=Mesorhizobium sp. AA22 TaxID=1854057 RepID=UPI0007ED156F|nr:hypothetical protein [Mesorhizobium sp. AA22]QIA23096.1 hypothetical protein A9K68_015935 [Mesorhizobium sp. AA22]
MNFEIKSVSRHWFPGETRDVVGEFDAFANGFSIKRGTIFRDHETGNVYAMTPGRASGRGIICAAGPFRDELCDAAVAAWEAIQ